MGCIRHLFSSKLLRYVVIAVFIVLASYGLSIISFCYVLPYILVGSNGNCSNRPPTEVYIFGAGLGFMFVVVLALIVLTLVLVGFGISIIIQDMQVPNVGNPLGTEEKPDESTTLIGK